MNSALLADIVVVAHFIYAAFVLSGFVAVPLGAALGWDWVRHLPLRIVHLAAIALVGVESVFGIMCPLTTLEYQLRAAAGSGGEGGAFIARIAHKLLFYHFPPWVFTATYLTLTALGVALFFLVPPRRHENQQR